MVDPLCFRLKVGGPPFGPASPFQVPVTSAAKAITVVSANSAHRDINFFISFLPEVGVRRYERTLVMMAWDPAEVTLAFSTSTARTTAIQRKDARSTNKDDTMHKFFGNQRVPGRIGH